MRRGTNFRTADLDRLDEQLGAVGLSPGDREVWEELLALGRGLARAREAAEAAGLIAGSAPLKAEIGDLADAFDRSFGLGPRAIVGSVPPRR